MQACGSVCDATRGWRRTRAQVLLLIVFGTQCRAEQFHHSPEWQRMLACVDGSCDCDGEPEGTFRLVADSASYWSALTDIEVCTSLTFCTGDSGDGDNERHVQFTAPGFQRQSGPMGLLEHRRLGSPGHCGRLAQGKCYVSWYQTRD